MLNSKFILDNGSDVFPGYLDKEQRNYQHDIFCSRYQNEDGKKVRQSAFVVDEETILTEELIREVINV